MLTVEPCLQVSSAIPCDIDKADLRTVAEIRFGRVREVFLIEPHRASAFIDFEVPGSALKAILASLSVRDGGDGGVLFGDNRRYLFEPRKVTILELYQPTDEDRRKLEKFLAESERGGEPGPQREHGREAEWSYEDRKVFECPM